VAVAEGAVSQAHAAAKQQAMGLRESAMDKVEKQKAKDELAALHALEGEHTIHLAHELEELTGLEARVSILGHLQRGGTPSAADRVLATQLGSACADYIAQDIYGVMVACRAGRTEAVPLEQVAGQRKEVPLDHPWIKAARRVGTNLGD
jgi:6-phosphofructokinase 1